MSEAETTGWEQPAASDAPPHGEALILDLEGFEGPLDLLLTMARHQKVDLKKISILALAEQYLTFIAELRKLRLEIAADYLVMAAWLTYLKSKLLLPEPPSGDAEPSGEEMAARLAFQLQRLEAMRAAGARLMARDRLGVHVFGRGMPEGIRLIKTPQWSDTLIDLLKAYTVQRTRGMTPQLHIEKLPVLAIEDARKRLERMLGKIEDWSRLDSFLPENMRFGVPRRSALASTLSASLEAARDGHLELRQLSVYGPIYLRRRRADASPHEADHGDG